MSRDGVEPLDAVPSTSYAPREYVIVNGLRYVVPYVEDVIYKVSTTREGASVLDCLVGHHAFQGQCVKGGGDRAHWQGELDARRVAIVSDVLARLPTGGDVPERWWATPASLDERVPRDSRLRVRRHVHEPCVHAEAPVVLTEDERALLQSRSRKLEWDNSGAEGGGLLRWPLLRSKSGRKNLARFVRQFGADGASLEFVPATQGIRGLKATKALQHRIEETSEASLAERAVEEQVRVR